MQTRQQFDGSQEEEKDCEIIGFAVKGMSPICERRSFFHTNSEKHQFHINQRSNGTGTWLWGLVLVAAVWAAHWEAEQLSHPLKKLGKQWGFSVAAGGALAGLAVASPEIGTNILSATRGVGDMGLGTMLGSDLIAIPVMVVTAYVLPDDLKEK